MLLLMCSTPMMRLAKWYKGQGEEIWCGQQQWSKVHRPLI
jgi:hypothetical protein